MLGTQAAQSCMNRVEFLWQDNSVAGWVFRFITKRVRVHKLNWVSCCEGGLFTSFTKPGVFRPTENNTGTDHGGLRDLQHFNVLSNQNEFND